MAHIRRVLHSVISAHSTNREMARREYILNILLLGSLILSFIAFCVNILNSALYGRLYTGELPITTFVIVAFIGFLLFLSKKGFSTLAARILIFLLLFLSLSVSFRWGADAYQALLMYSLVIIMSGILLGTKTAFLTMIVSGGATILFAFLEAVNLNTPDYEWKFREIRMGEAIVAAITLGIIAIVSWLSNREINKALKRALKSESALKKQRDQLEVLVDQRTSQLKQAQVEKITQLYRFAEFGRLASGLFHDLTNPLTVVSLNLNNISRSYQGREVTDAKDAIERAVIGTHKLQTFIQAAKKQIQDKEVQKLFSLHLELQEVMQILSHKSEAKGVKLVIIAKKNITTYANPLKFNQLVLNLISNAIDSYDGIRRKNKTVEIELQKNGNMIILSVRDWGSGIDESDLPRIFDPLYTTKPLSKGTGMGLSICRDIIQKDLKGKIEVSTQRHIGTTFTVTFPQQTRAHGKGN